MACGCGWMRDRGERGRFIAGRAAFFFAVPPASPPRASAANTASAVERLRASAESGAAAAGAAGTGAQPRPDHALRDAADGDRHAAVAVIERSA
jgi:hypothetical protein